MPQSSSYWEQERRGGRPEGPGHPEEVRCRDPKCIVASAHRTPDRVKQMVTRKRRGRVHRQSPASPRPSLVRWPPSPSSRSSACRSVGKVNLDSILSIVQMPPGIPVAAVGLDRGDNAALLAVEILAIKEPRLSQGLAALPPGDGGQGGEGLQGGEPLMFDPKEFVEEKIEELRTAITGKGHNRLLRGSGQHRGRRPGGTGHRRPASDRLRGHRPHAQGRDRVRGRDVSPSGHQLRDSSTPPRSSSTP